MPKRSLAFPSQHSVTLLSRLIFSPLQPGADREELTRTLCGMSSEAFQDLIELANSNHVLVRGLKVFVELVEQAGDESRAAWAYAALDTEHQRVEHALAKLETICTALSASGHSVLVMKSLDHWPDLGSDLDLYTDANRFAVAQLLSERFQAQLAPQSWGDRLAGKWNFLIPGLPEAVEIHMGRLGQTGEQVTIASRLMQRSRLIPVSGRMFRVAAASDRLLISTLQRMYRHFYFRLCDVLDTTELAESGAIDFEDLRDSATAAGIWEGVATYLQIVSDYMQQYRGSGLTLPRFVTASARFGGGKVYYSRSFLRVPILPQSAKLYGAQIAGLLRKRQLRSTARLSLLPWLAAAALVGHKLTGSDKGIW